MDFSKFNTKKIVFIIVDILLVIGVAFLFITLQKSYEKEVYTHKGDLTIWIYGDDKNKFSNFVEDWKQKKGITQLVTNIESFDSWEDYNLALVSAIVAGKAPDIFILNSSEKSLFEEQVLALDPKKFDADKFKNEYKNFLVNDLIFSDKGENGVQQDYLKGIPVGYEILGIFYNRLKGVTPSDFTSWSALFSAIERLKNNRGDIIPIGIGRGKSVLFASDIITQFFMLEGLYSVDKLTLIKVKTVLSTYFNRYAVDNGYDKMDLDLLETGRNNLDGFIRGEIAMIIGFPRLLLDIDKRGFRKSALYVRPFPAYFKGSGKTYVNYNYFVLNKDSDNIDAAEAFLEYLNSDEGALAYLKEFPYYFPAKINLEEDVLDRHILDGYKIKLKDFDNFDLEKSTFDKKIKLIYDRNIKDILDTRTNYLDKFIKFQSRIICKFKKIVELKSLSTNCEK